MIPRPSAAEPHLNPSTVLAIAIAGPGAWVLALTGVVFCARTLGGL